MSYTITVFDDYVATLGGQTTTFYSGDGYARVLGHMDQIALELTATQGNAANCGLDCWAEHSGDGIHWMKMVPNPSDTDPPIHFDSIDASVPDNNVGVGLYDGSLPTLGFVRIGVSISSDPSPSSARVKVVATLNDVREHAFTREITDLMDELEKNNHCKDTIRGGSRLTSGRVDRLKDAGLGSVVKESKTGYVLRSDVSICIGKDGSLTVNRKGMNPKIVPSDHGSC